MGSHNGANFKETASISQEKQYLKNQIFKPIFIDLKELKPPNKMPNKTTCF